MAVARLVDENQFVACCDAMSDGEASQYLRDAVARATDSLQQMTEGLSMVGRYTAVNEKRFKELGNKTAARSALLHLLQVHEQIDKELTPAMVVINDMTKRTTAETMKKVALTGVMASATIVERMEALYFDALGKFTHHAQIDVAGIDLDTYRDVPKDAWFSGLRSLVRGATKRAHGYLAKLERMQVFSVQSLMTSAAGAVMSNVLAPIVREQMLGIQMEYLPWFETYKIGGDSYYLGLARFACQLVQHADEARALLPPLIDMALKEFSKQPKGLRHEIDTFERIIRENRETSYIVGNVSKFREVRDMVRAQIGRIDSEELPLSEQLPVMHSLLKFLDTYWFDSRTRRWAIKPLCTILMLSTEFDKSHAPETLLNLKSLDDLTTVLGDTPIGKELPFDDERIPTFYKKHGLWGFDISSWVWQGKHNENQIERTAFYSDNVAHMRGGSAQASINAYMHEKGDDLNASPLLDAIAPSKVSGVNLSQHRNEFIRYQALRLMSTIRNYAPNSVEYADIVDASVDSAAATFDHAIAISKGSGVSAALQKSIESTKQLQSYILGGHTGQKSLLWTSAEGFRKAMFTVSKESGIPAKTFSDVHRLAPTSQEVRAAWELIRWGVLLLSAVAAYRDMHLENVLSPEIQSVVDRIDPKFAEHVRQDLEKTGRIGPLPAQP